MVITAVPFLLPLQFQLVFGWTPFAAGLMVAALFVGNLTDQAGDDTADAPVRDPPRAAGQRLPSVGCFGLLAALHAGTAGRR